MNQAGTTALAHAQCRRFFIAAALLAGSIAPSNAQVQAEASYAITLSGINVARADVRLKDDGDRYAVSVAADVSGMGTLVGRGRAKASVSGGSDGAAFSPEDFLLETETRDERFSVTVQYGRGDATAFVVTPPLINNIDRVPIERKHMEGVGDIITPFLVRASALDETLCERRMGVFTGLERFDLVSSFAGLEQATAARAGYQGPVVRCNLRYTAISGHFTTSELTNSLQQSDRLFVWYAPIGQTGYFLPYRMLLTTGMGDLSVVLTRLSF